MLELNKIHQGDCIELMKQIDDNSVDMILCDLPYGTTFCSWDIIIPLDKLWEQYKRILKSNGNIVLTSTQPFTSMLINSNISMFKYEWIWIKNKTVGFTYCKTQPLRNTENVLVFANGNYEYSNNPEGREYFNEMRKYIGKSIKEINTIMGNRFAEHCFYYKGKQFNLPDKKTYEKLTELFNLKKWDGYINFEFLIKLGIKYNPQGLIKKDKPKLVNKKDNGGEWVYNIKSLTGKDYFVEFENYPRQTLFIDCEKNTFHPTQKPVALFEYLIKTYTNEGDLVLDSTIGSGTTAIASINTKRNFIGMELEQKYVDIANKRISEINIQTTLKEVTLGNSSQK